MKRKLPFIATALLCGLGLVFSAAATTDVPEGKAENKLYATPDTAAALGRFAERLPAWAKSNVILIRKNDLHLSETEEKLFNSALNKALQDQVAGQDILVDTVGPYLDRHINSFPDLRAGNVAEKMGPRDRRALVQFLAFGLYLAGGARGFAPEEEGGLNRYCAIVPAFTEAAAMEPKVLLSRLIGIEPEDLENIPGTTEEWLLLLTAHEAIHCQQDMEEPAGTPDMSLRIANETMADQGAIAIYFNELAAGRVADENVPAALIAIRAMNAIVNRDIEHATHTNLNAHREHQHGIGYWAQAVTADDLRFIHRMIDERIAADEKTDTNDAYLIARSRPDVLYRTLEALNREGAFENNSRMQDFVSHFLVSARIHAPRHFGLPSMAP